MKKVILSLLVIVIAIFCISACTKTDKPSAKTYVLVHGAWQAPYVWNTVKAALIAKGQNVIVVELPAHGSDTTSPALVSINVYSAKVIAAINAVKGNVILVGHSMGGVVVTDVAEKIPNKIDKLIYIGAFVPANGQSLLDLAYTDKQSILGPNLIPSQDQLTLDVVHNNIINVFCQDASADIQNLVLQNYRVEPAIPFTNRAVITDANYGKVDKYYIHTLQDHAIGTDLQNSMVAAAKITKTYAINSGHSPFLTQPDAVTNLLLQIGQ